MKIHLAQEEIHQALVLYVESQGINVTDKDIQIEMTTKRNPTRISADISVVKSDSKSAPVKSEPATEDSAKDDDTAEEIFSFLAS